MSGVEWFKQFLLNMQRDAEFEKSIWTAFGHKNNDGNLTSPDVLVKLLLPMLREQYMSILDLFESVKLSV